MNPNTTPKLFSPAQIDFLHFAGVRVEYAGSNQIVCNVAAERAENRLRRILTGLAELLSVDDLTEMVAKQKIEAIAVRPVTSGQPNSNVDSFTSSEPTLPSIPVSHEDKPRHKAAEKLSEASLEDSLLANLRAWMRVHKRSPTRGLKEIMTFINRLYEEEQI